MADFTITHSQILKKISQDAHRCGLQWAVQETQKKKFVEMCVGVFNFSLIILQYTKQNNSRFKPFK